MLKFNRLSKSFDQHHILNNITASIEEGSITTIMGGNGAGKTTLFNIISGFVDPDDGELWFKGERIENLTPSHRNKRGIARTFQDTRLIHGMSVLDNVLLSFREQYGENVISSFTPVRYQKIRNLELSKDAFQILSKMKLYDHLYQKAGELSLGQQKLLSLCCCIANNPSLLLLDEPVASIDSEKYELIIEIINELNKGGKTIILIEHNKEFIQRLNSSIFHLDNGGLKVYKSFSAYEAENSPTTLNI